MFRELAFLLVFLLPVALFYFVRNEPIPSAIVNDKSASKSKKKKKKSASKASDLKRDLPVQNLAPANDNKDEVLSKADSQGSKRIEDSDAESPAEEPAPAPRPRGYVAASREADPDTSRSAWTTATTTKRRTGGNKRGSDPAQVLLNSEFPPLATPTTMTSQESAAAPLNVAAKAAAAVTERVRKVDPEADAPRVARVLRIKTDEPEISGEEEPLEDGWGRIRKTGMGVRTDALYLFDVHQPKRFFLTTLPSMPLSLPTSHPSFRLHVFHPAHQETTPESAPCAA